MRQVEQVVITGMGVISPLGNSVDSFWERLAGGQSGVSRIESFDTARFKTKIAGAVRGFDAEALFGRKEARRMDRFCQFAMAAAGEACKLRDLGRSGELLASVERGEQRNAHEDARRDACQKRARQPAQRYLAPIRRLASVGEDRRLCSEGSDNVPVSDHGRECPPFCLLRLPAGRSASFDVSSQTACDAVEPRCDRRA